MPSLCAVSGCRYAYDGQHSMLFHRFPREEALREKWISLCMNPSAINPNNAGICQLHFNASDYERHLKYELLQLPVPRKLKCLKSRDASERFHVFSVSHLIKYDHFEDSLKVFVFRIVVMLLITGIMQKVYNPHSQLINFNENYVPSFSFISFLWIFSSYLRVR